MTAKLDRLQLITTFLAIADQRSLSAAARVLRTTQPTVSRRLRELEHLLGARLATRSTHRFDLTSEGEELLRRAGAWVDEWSEWEEALKDTPELPRGKLSIIGPHAYGHAFLMDAVRTFVVRHPHVEVELRLTDRPVDLIGQAADCWIRVGGAVDQGLHVQLIGKMERILVASNEFLARNRIRSPDDLTSVPFVGLIPHVMDRITLLAAQGNERRTVPISSPVSTDGLLASYRAMRLGLGIAGSAHWLCGEDLTAGKIRRVLPRRYLEPIPVEVASVTGRYRPARIKAFVDILREEMRRLDGFELGGFPYRCRRDHGRVS